MGKTRQRRIRCAVRQNNPLGVGVGELDGVMFGISEEVGGETIIDDNTMGPIEAVREQLQNANIEEKLNGLQALAVLTGSAEKVEAICETDLVRIAAPLLCDGSVAVRSAAAGALRNLSVNGVKVCEFLVDQDLLTPLLTLLNEYARLVDWRPTFDSQMNNQMDVHSDVYLHAINLLWNLCESTPLALEVLNQSQLITSFIRCLDYNVYGLEIAISVAQCLLVISESNPKSWTILNDSVANFLCLLSIEGTSFSHFYLKTLAAGILANVPALAASYTGTIIQSLLDVLDENHLEVLKRLVPITQAIRKKHDDTQPPVLQLELESIDEETEEAAVKRRRLDELPTEDDLMIRDVGYIMDAKRVAAEILTNLCGLEDEDWEEIVDGDVSAKSNGEQTSLIHGGEEEEDGDDDGDDDGEGLSLDTVKLSKDVCEIIKCGNLVEKLWKSSQPLDDNLQTQIYDINIHLLIKLKNLRISSLLCLQNLFNCLSCKDLGGKSLMYKIWSQLGQEVFKEPQDTMILEPCTSLMRAALEHIKSNRELFDQLTPTDIELMLNGVRKSKVTEVRANWLRMLGTLGCLLDLDFVRVILSFLLETCVQEKEVWVLSEGVDALMDMFADNDWPVLVANFKLPTIARTLENRLKCKIREQRKELNERYPAVQTVCNNLKRFIKYLEGR